MILLLVRMRWLQNTCLQGTLVDMFLLMSSYVILHNDMQFCIEVRLDSLCRALEFSVQMFVQTQNAYLDLEVHL